MKKPVIVVIACAALCGLTGCSGEPQPGTPEQEACASADSLVPTIEALQSGEVSGNAADGARDQISAFINSDADSQVTTMVYVLANPDDSDTFSDFERQLRDYCEGYAGWDMSNLE